jgi:hypothetical protein
MTLLADALELWAPASGYAFEIVSGGPNDLPVFRGENVTLPSKEGQTYMTKVADHLPLVLHGLVTGEAAGATSAAQSFRTRMDALNDVVHPDNGQFTLTITGIEGLATGEQATITVEWLRYTTIQRGAHYRYLDIECQCLSDPPGWTVTSGS